jgi:hypothetical protein
MTIVDIYKIPALASLAVVTALLGLSIVASLLVPRKPAAPHDLDVAA